MGIRGLTSYIRDNEEFFESHELHSGYLVIDGPSLAFHLLAESENNSAFGGDYDVLARNVKIFFQQFHECKLTPLVILDGGLERKKMKTTFDNRNEVLQDAVRNNRTMNNTGRVYPKNLMLNFECTLKEMRVKVVRCVFEGDPCTAAIAKILNCPVLSADSDFYIFGSKFVPIDCLEPSTSINSLGNGYALRCKLYKMENLSRVFPGLDSSVLPLVAVLLGNDYVNYDMFKSFHYSLSRSFKYQRFNNATQAKIHNTLRWLKNYNLNDAIAAVLCTFPKQRRRKILDIMELVINGYLILPCELLIPLGFAKEYQEEMRARESQRNYKFRGNIDTLDPVHFWRGEPFFTCESARLNEKMTEEPSYLESLVADVSEQNSERFAESWPSWYSRDYENINFPSYFVELMFHRLYIATAQMEDCTYTAVEAISLDIVGVIDGLLVSGRAESRHDLTHVIRDETEFRHYRASTRRRIGSTIFPTLNELRDTPVSFRKQIFDDTLEIRGKEDLVAEIPSKWRIYIVALLYWIKRRDKPVVNSCHFYALLFTMLMGIIDDKIDFHRDVKSLKKIFKKKCKIKPKIPEARSGTIIRAIEDCTEEDCLQAAPFFIDNYTMDSKLYEFPNDFDITIVHAFSQFQNCIRHAIYLNALLGYPYECPIIAKLFNGTMLYNLYGKFEKQRHVETYIAEILRSSPNLSHILNLLMEKANKLLDWPLVDGYTSQGARSHRRAKIIGLERLDEYEDEYDEFENEYDEFEEKSTMSEEKIIPMLTPNVKKFLNPDVVNGDRGVKKRKYKKKRKPDDEDNTAMEDKVFRRISSRESPKCNRHEWHSDTFVSDESN